MIKEQVDESTASSWNTNNGNEQTIPVLFVAGTSFCGSTLLSFLLNAHPQMVCVGEETGPIPKRRNQPDFPCSCGAPLPQCPFWVNVTARMKDRGFEFGHDRFNVHFLFGRHRLPRLLLSRSFRNNTLDDIRDGVVKRLPGLGKQYEVIRARNLAMFRSIIEVSGKKVFASGQKDSIRAWHLSQIPGLDLKVVHLIRDSRGFVNSTMKNGGNTLSAGVRDWNRNASHVERLFARLGPDRCMRIRYEDLCADVTGTLAKLARFVGLEPMAGPVVFRETEHHVIGNRMRLQSSSEVKLDEAWRERLSPDQIAEIVRRTRTYRAKYGYEV